MKMVASIPRRAVPASAAWRSRPVQWTIASKQDLSRRVHHFAESKGRVERYLCTSWIDGACIGAIVVSILYFLPVLLPLLME